MREWDRIVVDGISLKDAVRHSHNIFDSGSAATHATAASARTPSAARIEISIAIISIVNW